MDKNARKNAENFYCELCDFKCSKQSDWNRHILRRKHLRNENDDIFTKAPDQHDIEIYSCKNCKRNYKSPSVLWKHKQNCKAEAKSTQSDNVVLEEANYESTEILPYNLSETNLLHVP